MSVFILIVAISCTNNDEQTDFERSAYSPASGITQTDNSSNIIGDPDEDDWRTSPFYTGIMTIDPAFPNPVLYGTSTTLDVAISGNSLTSILELGYFDARDSRRPWIQLDLREDISEFSLSSLTINTQLFGSNAELARGLHRIVLFDGNQRVVTYGDIQIE